MNMIDDVASSWENQQSSSWLIYLIEAWTVN